MKQVSVDVMQIWQNGEPKLTVTLRRKREFAVRLWLASKFIELGCWIARMGFEIEEEE